MTAAPRTCLYVAGPISNGESVTPELVAARISGFAADAARLRAAGYAVLDPGRHDLGPGGAWDAYMRLGLTDLLRCHGVAVRDEWWCSRGASLEVTVAAGLRMPVRTVAEWLGLPDEARRQAAP